MIIYFFYIENLEIVSNPFASKQKLKLKLKILCFVVKNLVTDEIF